MIFILSFASLFMAERDLPIPPLAIPERFTFTPDPSWVPPPLTWTGFATSPQYTHLEQLVAYVDDAEMEPELDAMEGLLMITWRTTAGGERQLNHALLTRPNSESPWELQQDTTVAQRPTNDAPPCTPQSDE